MAIQDFLHFLFLFSFFLSLGSSSDQLYPKSTSQ